MYRIDLVSVDRLLVFAHGAHLQFLEPQRLMRRISYLRLAFGHLPEMARPASFPFGARDDNCLERLLTFRARLDLKLMCLALKVGGMLQ